MPSHARAAVFVAPGQLVAREFPLPKMAPGDLLLEVDLCGVDGSELHMYKGEMEWINKLAPVIFGDEIVGRVCDIGSEARRNRQLEIGDRVIVEARWPCGNCRLCTDGQYYLCANNTAGRGYGTISCAEYPHLWGGYTTHTFVPQEALVYRVPTALHTKTALVAGSTLANGVRWTRLVQAAPGRTVAIIGPGPQGLACAIAAAHAGAAVVVIGLQRDAARLAMAEKLAGAETMVIAAEESAANCARSVRDQVGAVDAVIEAAGVPAAKMLSLELVRPCGIVAHVSLAWPCVQEVDWMKMLMKEATIINPVSHPHEIENGLMLARTLLNQGVDVGDLVSHVFPLEEAEQALQAAAYSTDYSPIKVALDPKDS